MRPDHQTASGVDADRPSESPRPGSYQIVKRAWQESQQDNVPLMSAGVAFYAFLALVPTLIAVVLIYGLVSDPVEVADQIESFGTALPSSAEDLLSEQMTTLAEASDRSLSVGLVLALAFALWSASNGIRNLITAVNVAYDEDESRGFVKSRALALGITVGAIVFIVVAVALVAAIPVVLDALDAPGWVRAVAHVGRWLGLVVAVLIALALLYRWAPDRDSPRFRWLSIGAVVATVVWVVASIGFSIYVDNFASYGKTYGSLAGVIVLLLWLWLGSYATLLGAEVNSVMEQGRRER